MGYLFLFTFAFFTVWHLIASLKQNEDNRKFSKGFILFSLMAFYIAIAPSPSIIVFLAIFFSWVGDLFLIPRGNKWIAMGGSSFMISHILFMISYIIRTAFKPYAFVYFICFGLIYLVIICLVSKRLKQVVPSVLFIPLIVYLMINGTMNTFAIYRFISDIGFASLITMVGAILFFISDVVLFFVRYDENFLLKTHFAVMLTYSLGELLIVVGLMII